MSAAREARISTRSRKSEDAQPILERAEPANDIDAAVRLVALQAVRYEHRLDIPSDDSERALTEMLELVSGLPADNLPLWLREFLVTTTWRLERRAEARGLPRHKALRAMRRRLLAMPEAAAEAVLDDLD
ncbi:hypothetical protein [Actinoplanes sp. NPDC049316]|uniref:hypothetical protein n=1 Tax=Actinoplanes sp. NPDC049316 TaxID=3154727 RepID=UPI00344A4D30